MTDQSILDALCGLLPGQFDRVLGEIGVPFEILSGPQTPQATRAVELIRWAKQREDRFRALMRALDVNLPPMPSPAPNATAKNRKLEHDRILSLLRAATDARLDRNGNHGASRFAMNPFLLGSQLRQLLFSSNESLQSCMRPEFDIFLQCK